jgi:hypothetical protein
MRTMGQKLKPRQELPQEENHCSVETENKTKKQMIKQTNYKPDKDTTSNTEYKTKTKTDKTINMTEITKTKQTKEL